MSKNLNSKFYRDFTIVIIVFGFSNFLVATYLFHKNVPLSSWIGLILLGALSIIVHKFLIKASGKRPQLFVASFMGALTAKLFLAGIFLIVVGLVDKSGLKFTAIGFFILYALLTIVDIRSLLPILRGDNN